MKESQLHFQSAVAGIVAAVMLIAGGCAKWKPEVTGTAIQLSQGQLPPDSVKLELAVLKIDPASIAIENDAWSELHPQEIDLQMRKVLASNGIRCGVATAKLPASLQTLIDQHQQRRRSEETAAESLIGEETTDQQLQVRSGQPTHIILSPTFESLSWIVDDDGYLYGREHFHARCQCTLKARPVGEGKVRIELIPEITHGIPQQRIGVGNNALIYEMSQDREVLQPLKIVTHLHVGQWLVVGNTEEIKGIGEKFFGESNEKGGMRKMVLIRLAESQPLTLFDRDELARPITTPTD